MSTNTTNLLLKKPAQNDNYNVDDQNGNMDILDSSITAIKGSLTDMKYKPNTGSANAIVVAKSGFIKSDGNTVQWYQSAANTTNPTINVESTGVTSLRDVDGALIPANELTIGYKTAIFNNSSGFFFLAPSGGAKIAGQIEITAKFAGSISKNDAVRLTGLYVQEPAIKQSSPATLPTGLGGGVAFSRDGQYMAEAHDVSPFVTIYKIGEDSVFTKLANPTTLPTGIGQAAAFSADGLYLAISHNVSPFITIYKRSGDVFTKLANPTVLPTGNCYGVSFSSDGLYLAVSHTTTPFITIYKVSVGDVFTKLANPTTLPAASGGRLAFSEDTNYLAYPANTLVIYKRTGDTFAKLSDPAIMPTGFGNCAAWSYDGTYMAIAHNTTPFITIYKRSGDTFTKLSNPATLPSLIGQGVHFSTDGTYMAVSCNGSPFILVYKRSGDVFTKLSDPSSLPAVSGTDIAFSFDGTYLVETNGTSPFMAIYKGTLSGTKATKSSNLITEATNAIGLGYAKESGVLNDIKKIIKLWG